MTQDDFRKYLQSTQREREQLDFVILSEPKILVLFSNRFKDKADENVSKFLSTSARGLRKRRNLVSMRFNMINWLLETTSLILVIIKSLKSNVFLTIFYLLVSSCGTPLVILFRILFVIFSLFLFSGLLSGNWGKQEAGQEALPVTYQDIYQK